MCRFTAKAAVLSLEFRQSAHPTVRTDLSRFADVDLDDSMPNKSRACVKSADMKFGNDQIFGAKHFDETSRRVGWSKNEFSHSLPLEPTPVGRFSSAFAVDITSPAWLSSRR
jgi:hypothetical protein